MTGQPTATAIEAALRRYIADLDYDLHKALECDEMTGEDTYPQEAQRFLRMLTEAARPDQPSA